MLLTHILHPIPYLFNNLQTVAFSGLFKPLKCNLHPTNTPFLLSNWWHVFIPALSLLKGGRKGTERLHTSKIIDCHWQVYSRQKRSAFQIYPLKYVLICHLFLIFLLTFSERFTLIYMVLWKIKQKPNNEVKFKKKTYSGNIHQGKSLETYEEQHKI